MDIYRYCSLSCKVINSELIKYGFNPLIPYESLRYLILSLHGDTYSKQKKKNTTGHCQNRQFLFIIELIQ